MVRHSVSGPESGRARRPRSIAWVGALLAWFVVLCVVPDPRPFGAPEIAVKGVHWVVRDAEPEGRVLATLVFRGLGLGMIGLLLVQGLGVTGMRGSVLVPTTLILAPLLAVAAQWINYTYFPIWQQVWFGSSSALLGALLAFILRGSRMAIGVVAVMVVGPFVWGTSTGIDDDLYEGAAATGRHVLDRADQIPDGDAGFEMLLEVAFGFAEGTLEGKDLSASYSAAILALSVILGQEQVARVARREIDSVQMSRVKKLRRRITLYGRLDLSQHFWVSAGLTVLSDDARSMAVGLTKELMDSVRGGSGFSFFDLTADRAGSLFALAATRNEDSARALQRRLRNGVVIADFVPRALDLPEAIDGEVFQNQYGGLGGAKTLRIVEEIERRLEACDGLHGR